MVAETKSDPTAEILGILDTVGYEGLEEVGAANRAHTISRLMSTKWKQLEAIEHADHLMFPDVLLRRKADGDKFNS